MSITLNKPRLDNLAAEIWKSAVRLRGKFKAYEYQGVILPIIVIRRLECVLIRWREDKKTEVRAKRPEIDDTALAQLVKGMETGTAPFSNQTDWTLRRVYEEDHTLLEANYRKYINGFSENVQEIIEHFNYRAIIGEMVKRNRLAPILNQYKDEPLGPEHLSNLEMGYVYEELLRRFSEEAGEEAGDHFTPREIVRLMVELLEIPIPDRHLSIYDPACGTGGMLSVAKEHLFDRAATDQERAGVEGFVTINGQELQPANYAICKADLLLKGDREAHVFYGNSLIPHVPNVKEPGDQLPESRYRFDYMLSNPPFGVTWGGKDGYEDAAKRLRTTRYRAGMPRINDGALLFLQTMLAKQRAPENGGSRIAIVFNGSPLSNGDCGSGESEIRRWILEHDWLDAIVMLPDQLFYNTGIFTYIWLLRTAKPADHQGRVMIIDARQQFEKEPKAFSNKRNRMTEAHRQWIEARYRDGWAPGYTDPDVRLFANTPTERAFAYHKVAVVFWQTDAQDQPAIVTEPYEKAFTPANIKKEQEFYDSDLSFRIRLRRPDAVKVDAVPTDAEWRTIAFTLAPADSFPQVFENAARRAFAAEIAALTQTQTDTAANNRAVRTFLAALRTEVEWTHRHYVKDDEYIPFGEDIPAFLEREIAKPIIRWKDSPQLGYEILPNKYFYRYAAPPPAAQLLAEFWRLERAAETMLAGLAE